MIIAISIPLAILAAIAALSATGQTLNIMTLGGLALAVGILVDDATVTIENINWHLEQGKGVAHAILDGAAQIVTPAFVSLLCICIVFVPMFFLPGVAGFLFVPHGAGGGVRDDRLLHPVAHPGADHGDVSAASRTRRATTSMPAGSAASRNPLVRFQRGFEARFERFRARLSRPAASARWRTAGRS